MSYMTTILTTLLAATTSFFFVSTHALNTRIVHQFPNPTWLENIAVTRNGSLLVSVIGRLEVHIINHLVTPLTASFVANIPEVNAVFGITEPSENVFAVAAGNTTSANAPVPGSFSVWSVDLTSENGPEKVNKLADTPELSMTNGLAALNEHTLLLADSWAGNIAFLDTRIGKTGVWFEDASTASNFSAPGLPLGVNGIRVRGEWAYYTNTVRNSLSCVRFGTSTGKVVGKVETLAHGEAIAVPDDFAVSADGSIILGRPVSDGLVKVAKDGKVEVVVKVEGVTAVALGRSKKDKKVAYLSSMGEFNADGSVKAGGRVVALQL